MKASPCCLNLIKSFEGLSLKPYLCPAGIPTIGYGSTRYADGRKVALSDQPITQEQAEVLLIATLKSYVDAVSGMITIPILHQCQFDALVSFAYNCGVGNLKSSTLLKLFNRGDFEGAADQFMRWDKAGGKVLTGLTARRLAEQTLFEKES